MYSYTYFTSTYYPWMPNAGKCAGEEFAAFSGMIIISSYLFLFLGFYAATYKKSPPKKGSRSRSISALVEMKDEKLPTVGETRRRLSGVSPPPENGLTTGTETPSKRVTRSRKA